MRRVALALVVLCSLLFAAAPAGAGWRPLGPSIDSGDLTGAPSATTVGGVPYVAYLGPGDDVRVSFASQAGWQRLGGSLTVDPARPVGPEGLPQLIDDDAELYVVWTEDGVPHVKRETGLGSWVEAGDPFELAAGERAEWVSGENFGNPLVAWVTRDPLAGTSELRVARRFADEWVAVGGVVNGDTLDSITDVRLANVDGDRYLLYREVHAGVSRLRVQRYDSAAGAWTVVGGPVAHLAGAPVSDPTIASTGNGIPTVAWYESAGGGVDLRVARFEGDAWTELGGPINLNRTGARSRPSLVPGLDPEIAISEASVSGGTLRRVRVFKWDGTAWQKVGGDLNRDPGADASQPSFTSAGVFWSERDSTQGRIFASVFDPSFIATDERVSVSTDEAQADDSSGDAAVSANGRYVAFASQATNLVGGDVNATGDIFVRDRLDGTTARVAAGDGESYEPSISDDGRFVAFASDATSLVAGDTNGLTDAFVHDRQTQSTVRVSVASDGAQILADGAFSPSISGDGRFVAFESTAPGLVPGDTGAENDVFVHDRQTGATQRIATGPTSGAGPQLSADGRQVAFLSDVALVAGDTNGELDVFVHDRETSVTERVSVSSAGAQATGQRFEKPSISADGRYVAFASRAGNLVSGDDNTAADVFVRDRELGTTELVSLGPGNQLGNSRSGGPWISADGGRVAFDSNATNFVSGPDDIDEIFVRDREAGTTLHVSATADGGVSDGRSSGAAISDDGSFVTFASGATNLVADDTNAARDIFGVELDGAVPPPPPPAAPTVVAVSPVSGSNDNTPQFAGTAPAGTTVTLYGNAQCTGSPLASGTAAVFESVGIEVTVADNSTTTVYATASNANGTSACSTTSVTYVEDSNAATIKWAITTASVPETVGTISLIVERSGNTAGTTIVAYQTIPDTAVSPDDFVHTAETLTFAPGEKSKLASVAIVDDILPEETEGLTVRLGTPTGGVVQQPSTLDLTITDDDRIDTAITAGPEGPTNDPTPEFAFTADPAAGATFECAVDAAAFAACTTPHTIAALPDGPHTFRVRAVKPNGARDATPATRAVLVDTVRPDATPSLLGDFRSPGRYFGTVRVLSASDDPAPGSGIGETRCQVDPVTPPETASDMSGACPAQATAAGPHTAYAAAIDKAGNAGVPQKVTFTIVAAPDTTITRAPSGPQWSATGSFSFSSSIAGSTFRCRIDGGPAFPCTDPYTTPRLPSADHVFEVSAVSPDGVEDPSPARATLVVPFQQSSDRRCIIDNFPYTTAVALFVYYTACHWYSDAPGNDCEKPTQCFKLATRCPAGAECTIRASSRWADQDTNAWWIVRAIAGSSGGAHGLGVCLPGWDGSQCTTGAEVRLLGPEELNGSCNANHEFSPKDVPGSFGRPSPTYGPGAARYLECELRLTIAPAAPLRTLPGAGRSVQVAAPGAGTVSIAAAGASGGRSATIAARARPFTTKPVTVTEAGAAELTLKLSKVAKGRLRRKGKLPLSMTVAFTPAGGGEAMRAKRRVTLRTPIPLRECRKVDGKRRCFTS